MNRKLRIELDAAAKDGSVRPETVDVRDLFLIVIKFRDAIAATADCPDARQSLVAIESSSCLPVLEMPTPDLVSAGDRVLHAIDARTYDAIPRAAHEAIHAAYKFAVDKSWTVKIKKDEWSTDGDVEISELEPVPPPPKAPAPAFLSGKTTIYGDCVHVGGTKSPRVTIKPLNGQRQIEAEASKDVAKELGRRLYETVGVSGNATWDVSTWEIVGFKVDSISGYRRTALVDAFQDLQRAVGGAYDAAEAFEKLRELRGE